MELEDTATISRPGRLDVFAQGTDGCIYHRALAGVAWDRAGGLLAACSDSDSDTDTNNLNNLTDSDSGSSRSGSDDALSRVKS